MNDIKTDGAALRNKIGLRFSRIGFQVLRYGLVLVIGWIGLMKFTEYEANGIRPLVAHSPLMGWMYHILSVQHIQRGHDLSRRLDALDQKTVP